VGMRQAKDPRATKCKKQMTEKICDKMEPRMRCYFS
jgi:hypothetical protein